MREEVLIVGSGEDLPDKKIIRGFSNVVCADGGYDRVKGIVKPLAVIGDMDSLSTKIEKGIEVVVSSMHKDETDTELALRWCIKQGFEDIYMTGTHGTRPDHFFASLILLKRYKGMDLHILTPQYDIFLMDKDRNYSFCDMKGSEVSFFSFGERSSGIVSKGFRYEYADSALRQDDPLGVSNEIIRENASIYFKKGSLLCFVKF